MSRPSPALDPRRDPAAILVFADGWLLFRGQRMRCALGRGGVRPAREKREGDGATPAGTWPLRRILYRADREPPPGGPLPRAPIALEDGWCDDPRDGAYNRPVRLPYPASAEEMWRKDDLYDLVVVLGHNDDPPVPGAGSAIFLHVARPDFAPTAGCVALPKPELRRLLAEAPAGARLVVMPERLGGA
ncbi:MAG: L,D-transpeptidase family protein [Alphaproteobacteria bacterium]|nr:L,D-transpeptidase family protein [Alphaproteobacteria bacterium]